MSKMEYNKGKLIPIDVEYEDCCEDEYDYYLDNGYACVNGEIYMVDWENRSEDLDDIARASTNSDGTIDFETYHYNGGAHWTEVVEVALKKS